MLMRTRSLHRPNINRQVESDRQGSRNGQPRISTPIIGGGPRSWHVRKWLSQVSTSPESNPRFTGGDFRWDAGHSPLSAPLRERRLLQVHQQTPAMALVLKKLREMLPVFCRAMAECQFVKCCALLGSAMSSMPVAPAGHQASGSASPPIFRRASPPNTKSSPSRSPIRAWLARGGMDQSRNEAEPSYDEIEAARVLESKMEVFFLLVGIESMYQSLAHADSPRFAQLLITLLEQTIKDIQLLRLTLCDAFLVSHHHDQQQMQQQASITHKSNLQGGEEEEGRMFLSSESTSRAMAESVSALASSLLFLVSFCQARVQCIQIQSALWHQQPGTDSSESSSHPTFADIAMLFESIAANLKMASTSQRNTKSSTSQSLESIQELSNTTLTEIGVWIGLCQTAFSVQNCRFAESIMGAQSTKAKLVQLQKLKAENKKASCLELWMQDALKSVVGTFPIIFDKVLAFAKPLYGFEEEIDVQPSAGSTSGSLAFRSSATADAFEADVMDALHRFEKLGAISVSVVLDAARTSNVLVEHGFSLLERSPAEATVDPEVAVREQYPAVYIRTISPAVMPCSPASPRTNSPGLMAGAQSPSVGSTGAPLLDPRGVRRESGRKSFVTRSGSSGHDVFDDGHPISSPRTSSTRKLLKSWSKEDASIQDSPIVKNRKHGYAMNALQYEVADGRGSHDVSWPHSEWATLASILSEKNDDVKLPIAETPYGDQGQRPPSWDKQQLSHGQRMSYGNQTLYCIENISDSIWLVVMMKNLDFPVSVSGWQWQSPRPTSETVEEGLRELVSHLASIVRVKDHFEASAVQAFRNRTLERSSDEIGAGLAEELKERGVEVGEIGEEGIIRLIKNQLKVLAQMNTPNAQRGSSLPSRSRILRQGSSRRGKMSLRSAGHTESAAALFLGRELMHSIVFD